MGFKGDEFLRNVEIEKEKAKLRLQEEQLDAQKRQTTFKEFDIADEEPVIVDIYEEPSNGLNDILLEEESNDNIKKKYITIAIALTILFILTMVVIRFLSTNDKQPKLFEDTQNISQDRLLDNQDQYNDITTKHKKDVIQEELDIQKIQTKETPVPLKVQEEEAITPKQEQQPAKNDLFGMQKNDAQVQDVPPVVKETSKKEIQKVIKQKKKKIVQQPKKTTKKKIIAKNSGFYIQVGAFTKMPKVSFLLNIKNKGYSYIIYPMVIKNKKYNKVLIGPYKTRAKATTILPKVKGDLKRKYAYILELK
jgi:DedD protein